MHDTFNTSSHACFENMYNFLAWPGQNFRVINYLCDFVMRVRDVYVSFNLYLLLNLSRQTKNFCETWLDMALPKNANNEYTRWFELIDNKTDLLIKLYFCWELKSYFNAIFFVVVYLCSEYKIKYNEGRWVYSFPCAMCVWCTKIINCNCFLIWNININWVVIYLKLPVIFLALRCQV